MASIVNSDTLKLVAFTAADNGKSLFSQDTRDVLATAPSGSFVDVTDDVLAVESDFLSLASVTGKLNKTQRGSKQRVNMALSRAVKRDNDTRKVSAYRFIARGGDDAETANDVIGYGIIIA